VSSRSKRWLILPILFSAAVIAGGLVPLSALRDAVSGDIPGGMQLVLPPAYVLLSPLSRLLDTMSLLSTGQHIAVGLTNIAVTLLVAGLHAARSHRRALRVMTRVATSFGILIAAYACAAALPRPMAMLSVSDPNVVRVDFHSHTNFSHDARRGFTPEANRAWHRAAGFDVAYISDHNSFTGAEAAGKRNPARAGEGTVLLSAFEGRYLGTFEIFLSLTQMDSAALLDSHRRLLEGTLRLGRLPASVAALPSPLKDVHAEARDSAPHIAAIEIVDGSPRGFAQQDWEGSAIIRRADSLGLALVVGSNDHGWGRVAPGWTLVSAPGWRALAPDSLGAVIENTIRASPRTAVHAVERRRPTEVGLALAFTVPVALVQLFGALTLLERLVWLVWIWGASLMWYRVRRGGHSSVTGATRGHSALA
jgi:predicted metal-dependent phosphoesterase TrpH